MNDPLVSICCLAYNQEPYIRQCLDGFLMQMTNFAIEVLIHDDASTDGTADIIREYEKKSPEIIKPIYQTENQYSKGVSVSATYQFPRAKGKYIAMCEGDDYWTDPFKLQKEVDILEAHPETGMVHTDADIKEERTGKVRHSYYKSLNLKVPDESITEHIFLREYPVFTCTVLFRRELLSKIDISAISRFPGGDFFLWTNFSQLAGFHFLPDSTAVRRKRKESATQSENLARILKFWERDYEMYKFFLKKYPQPQRITGRIHWVRASQILETYFRMKDERSFRNLYSVIKKEYGTGDAPLRMKQIYAFSGLKNGFTLLDAIKLDRVLNKSMKLWQKIV